MENIETNPNEDNGKKTFKRTSSNFPGAGYKIAMAWKPSEYGAAMFARFASNFYE